MIYQKRILKINDYKKTDFFKKKPLKYDSTVDYNRSKQNGDRKLRKERWTKNTYDSEIDNLQSANVAINANTGRGLYPAVERNYACIIIKKNNTYLILVPIFYFFIFHKESTSPPSNV